MLMIAGSNPALSFLSLRNLRLFYFVQKRKENIMNQNVLNEVYYGTRKFVKVNASSILSLLAVVGVIGTTVSVGTATNKAKKKLDEATEYKGEALNDVEIITVVAPVYIPSILWAGSTIACILGASVLSRRSQAALTSAYALADQSFKEYRNKLIELHGEEADQEVQNAIIHDHIVGTNCQYHQIHNDNPDVKLPFYEPYSKTVLYLYEKELIDAEYHFNRNFTMRGYATLNEWFQFLGIDWAAYAETLGWSICDGYTWVDFEHRLVTEEDGSQYYVIDYVFEPDAEWQEQWGF